MEHFCKFEEVIPRIDRKLEKMESKLEESLRFKYFVSTLFLTISSICGIVYSLAMFFKH